MVLPPPAAGAVAAQADTAWLRRLSGLLELDPRSVMVLVEAPDHASIGAFIRAVGDRHGFVHVLVDMHELLQLPEGSLAVLCPRAEDAEWLNIKRPWIVERSLRVLIWADHDVASALHERAPDFYDWISHHQPCPPTPVTFAQAGLRAAVNDPGVCWPDSPEAFEALLRSVEPDAQVVHISAAIPYQNMVNAASAAGNTWIVWRDVDGPSRARRVRWALAEIGRSGRSALCGVQPRTPGWTPLHARRGALHELAAQLAAVDAPTPARLAALCDLEPEAVALLAAVLDSDDAAYLTRTALMQEDPGATLAAAVFQRIETEDRDAPPLTRTQQWPLHRQHREREGRALRQRLLADEPGDAALMATTAATAAWQDPLPSPSSSPLLRGWQVEALLRGGRTRATDWLAYAAVAGLLANADVQLVWANHGLQRVHQDEATSSSLTREMFSALEHLDNGEVSERILSTALQAVDTDTTSGAMIALHFAMILTARGKLKRAETLLRDTLIGLESERADPSLFAMVLDALVDVLDELGSPDAENFRRRLDALDFSDPPGHYTAHADDSGSTVSRTHAELADELGADHPRTLRSQLALAEELAEAGRHAESRALIDAASREYETSMIQDPHLVAELASARISAHCRADEFIEAERTFRGVSQFFSDAIGLEHPAFCGLAEEYAEMLLAAGKLAEAETVLRELIQVAHDAHGVTSELHRETVVDLAELLCDEGRWNEADACLEALVPPLREAHVDDADLYAEIDLLRARIRVAHSLFPEAEELLRALLARPSAESQSNRTYVHRAVTALGELLMGQARYADAAELYADALARTSKPDPAWTRALAAARRALARSPR